MNQAHLDFLASDAWAKWLRDELIPWLDTAGELGDDVLEIGPGPGLTTDLLAVRVPRLTVVELDPSLANALSKRLGGTTVTVVHADATDSGLPSDRFSAVACFSMLHHVPTRDAQDHLFREVLRMLRPGGTFFVSDSQDLEVVRIFHDNDIFVPIGGTPVEERLSAAGFEAVSVSTTDFEVRITARKPSP